MGYGYSELKQKKRVGGRGGRKGLDIVKAWSFWQNNHYLPGFNGTKTFPFAGGIGRPRYKRKTAWCLIAAGLGAFCSPLWFLLANYYLYDDWSLHTGNKLSCMLLVPLGAYFTYTGYANLHRLRRRARKEP